MSNSTTNTHLLVYPFTGSSHITPLLDFTHLLLLRGLVVTVIISPANLPLLEPLSSSHPSSFHPLIFPEPDLTPSPYFLLAKVISTQKLFNPIVQWFKSHPSPPVAIISDFFLGWTNELASYLGIHRIVFSTSGALASSIFHALWRDVAEINADNRERDENFLISFPEIPNSPEVSWWQLPPLSRDYMNGEPDFENFRKGILGNMASWGIVYNTFEDLEGAYINHMKKQMGHDRVWAVGPLLHDENSLINTSIRGGSNSVPRVDLLMWLNEKPDNSVVYICFGSRVTLNEKQIGALMGALELSNVNFILCAKKGKSDSMLIRFEDQVGDRGFILKGWAPQLGILRHRAVGTFLTHSGWNSILEGVVSGVTMLTWPQGADQYANEKLLVDELGVGKRVCVGGPDSVPDSFELARLLDESLSDDNPERFKVKELSQAGIKAVKEGTSIRDLDMFIKLVTELLDY